MGSSSAFALPSLSGFWFAAVVTVMAFSQNLSLTLAFQAQSYRTTSSATSSSTSSSTSLFARPHKLKEHSLLQEFSIASGEIINPYEVLKVPRHAERPEVRAHYIQLSRRFHPDAMRRDGILPGRCNNLTEVRDEWERIKLAYEILGDPQRRKRYDRNEALADPGQAVQRAAVHAAFRGVTGMGKGMFDMGAFAVQSLTNQARAAAAKNKETGRSSQQQQQQQDSSVHP